MKKNLADETADRRKNNPGRPPVLSMRDQRQSLRHAERLHADHGSFNIKCVKMSAGIPPHISDETVRRIFRTAGLRYCHSRKKGILKRKDLKARVEFARKVRALVDPSLWTKGIAFYLDRVGFAHKYNPFDQAVTPKSMAWRRPADGLSFE